jgi:hypothetical protein
MRMTVPRPDNRAPKRERAKTRARALALRPKGRRGVRGAGSVRRGVTPSSVRPAKNVVLGGIIKGGLIP